jgi:hypothetical protein
LLSFLITLSQQQEECIEFCISDIEVSQFQVSQSAITELWKFEIIKIANITKKLSIFFMSKKLFYICSIEYFEKKQVK